MISSLAACLRRLTGISTYATPKMTLQHWAWAFQWAWPRSSDFAHALAQDTDLRVARANAASVTISDALTWLQRLLVIRPRYSGNLPLVVSMALREVEARPADFGVTIGRMSTWKRAVGDPLMGF